MAMMIPGQVNDVLRMSLFRDRDSIINGMLTIDGHDFTENDTVSNNELGDAEPRI